MREVDILEARTSLPTLLEAVERGEGPIAIMRDGEPVVWLSTQRPWPEPELTGAELVARLQASRAKQLPCPELDGLSWEELKAEMWRA